MVYVYIWEYEIKESYLTDFLTYYGQNGSWQKFFSQSDGYIKTELLKRNKKNSMFMTIDYWKNKNEYLNFITMQKSRYDEIDKNCENFSLKEIKLGDFEIIE